SNALKSLVDSLRSMQVMHDLPGAESTDLTIGSIVFWSWSVMDRISNSLAELNMMASFRQE
ncbi:TPA: hypothetical protein ACSP2J_004554, partial [Aeromonas hydrophila]